MTPSLKINLSIELINTNIFMEKVQNILITWSDCCRLKNVRYLSFYILMSNIMINVIIIILSSYVLCTPQVFLEFPLIQMDMPQYKACSAKVQNMMCLSVRRQDGTLKVCVLYQKMENT